MEKLVMALKSRTVWTVVLLVITNGLSAFSGNIQPDVLVLINTVLGALAVYFKVSPSQTY